MTDTDDPGPIAHTDPRSHGDRTPCALDAEHALLGCLLRADTVEQVAAVLAAVTDDDFANPFIRDAIGLIRAAVADQVLPVPSVLLARLTTEQGTHRHKQMSLLFVDSWWAGPPIIAARPLLLAVLEGAYRRCVQAYGDRIRQASIGPLDMVSKTLSDTAAIRASWARLAAAQRGTNRKASVA